MRKPQNDIIEKAGIEIVGGEYGFTTINEELQTRANTRRKINRAIGYKLGENCHNDEFPAEISLDDLNNMMSENDHYIGKLVQLKRDISPFKNVEPECKNKFEVGAILSSSWGWEQTNIDFYCIVERKGQFITIMPMVKASTEMDGNMTRKERPIGIDFTGDPSRKKIQLNSEGQEYGFATGGSFGYCKLWKGQPETSTHYA